MKPILSHEEKERLELIKQSAESREYLYMEHLVLGRDLMWLALMCVRILESQDKPKRKKRKKR